MNLAEGLAREIRRVSELRCQYEKVGRMPNVIVAPALMMMAASLEAACVAAGSNDIAQMMTALEQLKAHEK